MNVIKKLTRSARGELFNPLLWPFLLSTLSYGLGFAIVFHFGFDIGTSSLYLAMESLLWFAPIIWGLSCIAVIVMGVTYLLFNVPRYGRISGLIGFSLWFFAGACYVYSGGYLTLFSVVVPNMWFWFWQYLSLSRFRREEVEDNKSL